MDIYKKVKLILIGIGVLTVIIVMLLVASGINEAVNTVDKTYDHLMDSIYY